MFVGGKDCLETLTERAIAESESFYCDIEFEFDRKIYRAVYGAGVVVQVGEIFMGGNYNEFPWVDRGRSSWESRVEEQRKENKAKAAAAKQALMAPPQVPPSGYEFKYQFQNAAGNATAASPLTFTLPDAAIFRNPIMFDLGSQEPGKIFWSGPVAETGNMGPRYSGISREEPPNEKQLRAAVRLFEQVLGRHLREQLAAAPSSGSVYAQGPGYAITAFEIKQVVQALDAVKGIPEFFPQPRGMGVTAAFEAESEDGEKIVLSKDGDRFDSGVLFDPSNRPIRKFKLKELAA